MAYEDEQEVPPSPLEADLTDASGKPINQQSMNGILINAELRLPVGDHEELARVIRRSIGPDGKIVGEFNDNPLLNTLIYEVEFPDGQIKRYLANVITENILQQVDSSGYHSHTLSGVIDARKDKSALGRQNA